jgi:membrane protein DedA with SNARE-associated domain
VLYGIIGAHMEHILPLIYSYGYVIIFFGTLLEGETFVALGGFAAYQGHLSLQILIPVAIVGAFIGDNLFFYAGRLKGRVLLRKFSGVHRHSAFIERHLENNYWWLILVSRFMYGFRAMLPVLFGASKVPAWKFMVLNATGAILWGIVFAFGGYAFGGALESFLGNMRHIEGSILLVVILVAVIFQTGTWIRNRRKGREEGSGDRDAEVVDRLSTGSH